MLGKYLHYIYTVYAWLNVSDFFLPEMRMRTSGCDAREHGTFVLGNADRTLMSDNFDHLISRGLWNKYLFLISVQNGRDTCGQGNSRLSKWSLEHETLGQVTSFSLSASERWRWRRRLVSGRSVLCTSIHPCNLGYYQQSVAMVTGLVDFPEKGYNVIILVFGSRANNNYCDRSLCVSPAAGIFPIKDNFFRTPKHRRAQYTTCSPDREDTRFTPSPFVS